MNKELWRSQTVLHSRKHFLVHLTHPPIYASWFLQHASVLWKAFYRNHNDRLPRLTSISMSMCYSRGRNMLPCARMFNQHFKTEQQFLRTRCVTEYTCNWKVLNVQQYAEIFTLVIFSNNCFKVFSCSGYFWFAFYIKIYVVGNQTKPYYSIFKTPPWFLIVLDSNKQKAELVPDCSVYVVTVRK